jgi:hypothetical protein
MDVLDAHALEGGVNIPQFLLEIYFPITLFLLHWRLEFYNVGAVLLGSILPHRSLLPWHGSNDSASWACLRFY